MPFPLHDSAREAGLAGERLQTDWFEHWAYRRVSDTPFQVVFIEGDGRPWSASGQAPADDPTPRNAVAFELMLRTPASALYITRPCYFGLVSDRCSSERWTSGRYANQVVDSMEQAIRQATDPARPLIFVGYSGGGALAVLLAPRFDNTTTVVTVAGLLDTDSWTDYHGYDPLTGSLNPARTFPHGDARYLHLHGARDTNVPLEQLRLVVSRWPNARLETLPEFDHVCCWVRDWPRLWTLIIKDYIGIEGGAD